MNPDSANFVVIGTVILAIFIFVLILFLASRYRRCPSNKVLVIFGKVGGGKSARCLHGGGTFVWPLIQDYHYLDLTPMTINIPLKGALSQQNIRINVPSTFTFAIDTSEKSMNNAAVRLLRLNQPQIESMAAEIIFGQLRLTVASLTIEQINQDRERFLEAIRKNIDTELEKIGLYLINVNITDITDESGYIESIGKKAASTAVNQARVDVAEQEKKGAIGEADASKEKRIQVAQFNALAVEGENTSQANIANYNATLAEKEAEANQRGEVARQVAEAEIQRSKALAETRRLEASEVVPREIEKRKIEIDAEAMAEQNRKIARGKADAIISVRTAEAEGIQKVLNSKAEGYAALVKSAKDNTKDAATLLMVEKLDEIVKLQTEAIKNIKIDKITVWDSGNGENGSSTANFMSNLIKTLPPLHEVAKLAGLNLPDYLGHIQETSATKTEPSEKTEK
ncbi:MAG: flotillin family protein [Bacteroidetes bacterium]|nr:flotillin family protein [Bacteroidota bacterium]